MRDRRELVDVDLRDVSNRDETGVRRNHRCRPRRHGGNRLKWYTDEPVVVPLEPQLDYCRYRVDAVDAELERERLKQKIKLARML